MPCDYYKKSKDNVWDGIYCGKIGGRPGNDYWRCYCDGNSGDCPFRDGRDPYALHPDTRERNHVIELINDIPSPVTENSGSAIENARYAYSRLNSNQRRFVDNEHRLSEAERQYKEAVAAAEAREQVVYMIDHLPYRATESSRYSVESARRAYDDLDRSQQRRVSNYHRLQEAEAQLEQAAKERNRESAESASYKEVISRIEHLPPSITEKDRHEVESVRFAFDNLDSAQQRKVYNYHVLTAAESELKQARANQREDDSHHDNKSGPRDFREEDVPLGIKFKVWLETLTNPREHDTHWAIRACRVLLPLQILAAMKLGLRHTPEFIWKALLVFSLLQLFSFVFSFIRADMLKFRAVIWAACLISAIAAGIMVYMNYTLAMLIEVLAVIFAYIIVLLIIGIIKAFT